MSKLQIARELALPLAAATEVVGFIGRRGQGKTYAAQRFAELLHEHDSQFVVLDPVGNWWGLRLAKDGKSPGLEVPVFGGLHGDIPLEPTAGAMIADVVADRGLSCVVDVSQFESDAQKARFAHDFGARLYYRKKAAPSALTLFLEECQEFVPQNPQREEARTLHVYQRLAKLGRNYGFGVVLISQRPQEVHKKVLNLCELLFVFQLTGPHERKAIAGWIQDKGIDEDIHAELPKLQRGAPHAWSPAWLKVSEVVHITEKRTFDASSTPTTSKAKARELAPIDLEKLRADMAATIERAKAEDPRELRATIARLNAELAKRPTLERTPAKTVEKFVLKDGQLARAEKLVERWFEENKRHEEKLIEFRNALAVQLTGVSEAIRHVTRAPAATMGATPTTPPTPRTSRAVAHDSSRATARPPASGGSNGHVGAGERAILIALAQNRPAFPAGLEREQLTILTGYKRSSRDTYLQRLTQKGLTAVVANGLIAITPDGEAAVAGYEPGPAPGPELLRWWLARLGGGEQKILELLSQEGDMDREQISTLSGYKRSSRDSYIQRLAQRRLVVAEGGVVRLADVLVG